MLLAVVIILVLLLAIYLLLAPIVLYIDTASSQYYIQLKGLLKASVEAHEEEVLRIHLKVVVFHFYLYPLKKIWKPKKEKKNGEKKRIRATRRRMSPRTILRLLRSFKVKEFMLDVDTGNCITNSKLYPLFAFLNFYAGGFNVNYAGRNLLTLRLQNRSIAIIRSFINH
ncbi:hypothetical protein ACFQ1M_07345 [Sungkyunkwania multivorans]|uniref:Uncharacterized protein n=1 Tax=Sungkyunkwania multivorans TaxID=1173618 RepID=A0ABW3CXV2_9FLAO